MRALLVLGLAFVCAAMVAAALAFGESAITAGFTAVASQTGTSEPAAMLLSGSALLGLAGAVKRLSF
jgi:hypothetical protein